MIKEEFVRQLQLQRKTVAMVGDGINDSQALACADVSIAMGKGTDIAMDVAMVTLMTSDLLLLPKAFNLSRQTVPVDSSESVLGIHLQSDRYSLVLRITLSNQWIIAEPHVGKCRYGIFSVSVVLNSLRLRY